MPSSDDSLLFTIEKLILDLEAKYHPNLRMNLSSDMEDRLSQREGLYNHYKTLIKEKGYSRNQINYEIEKDIAISRNKLEVLEELHSKLTFKPPFSLS